MREFIIADNQDITKAGMMFLLGRQKDTSLLLEADNKAELIPLVLFHKYNRFRTQYYNPTRKAGLKKEYETLFYQYHRMIHSCLLESKKQKESIPSCYSSKIKVSPLPFSLSNRQNLQILSNRFTNPFKSENRTFNKSFFRFYHLYLLHT